MSDATLDRCDRATEHDAPPPRHEAEALTHGGRKATIALHDQLYTLHITKQGKLLLTK